MKKIVVLFALMVAIVAGCALPSREDINRAKTERDGVERPVNESAPVSEE